MVLEMEMKFPVTQKVLDDAYDDLLRELDRLNNIRGYLVDLIAFDGSDLSNFLQKEFNDLGERYQLISSVTKPLHAIRYYKVVEVAEGVEVPSVVNGSSSSYAKKINQVREDLMKSQESIFFRETIEILKEFTDEQGSNVLHQLLGWFYKDDEFLGKMKEFALDELNKRNEVENSES
jgi:hypothetical protein